MGIIWKVKVRRDSTPHRQDVAGMRRVWVRREDREEHIGWDFYRME